MSTAQLTFDTAGAGVPPASSSQGGAPRGAPSQARRRGVMPALLIKDFRLCKPIIIASIVALVIPPVAAAVGRILDQGLPHAVHPNDVADFRDGLSAMVMVGLALASLTLAILAATALGRERRDRSGEFLRTLSISRTRLFMSKAIVVGGWSVFLWIGALVLAYLISSPPRRPLTAYDFWLTMLFFPAIALSLVGLAWWLASFMRSDMLAAAISIAVVLTLLIGFFSFADRLFVTRHGDDKQRVMMNLVAVVHGVIGVYGLAAGSIIALRRRSP